MRLDREKKSNIRRSRPGSRKNKPREDYNTVFSARPKLTDSTTYAQYLLRMSKRQISIMAKAPMLSLRICSSCMSSQLLPEYPPGQRQV